MTKTTYTYSVSNDFAGVQPDRTALSQQIAEDPGIATPLFSIEANNGMILITFNDSLSAVEKTVLDTLVTTHPLWKMKFAKFAAIDTRTAELIGAGFTFAGKVFSLSIASQITLLGLDLMRNDPALVYPVVYNTLKDDGTFDLSNAATVHDFVLTAIGTYRAHKDAGTVLKNQVRAATTLAEVEAVVDNR